MRAALTPGDDFGVVARMTHTTHGTPSSPVARPSLTTVCAAILALVEQSAHVGAVR